ncbi:hypothetical protein [Chryseobacterium schmidteae]|uniref:hypothetical protein n=1 Tax=Chryseobacterium schmidteae TaxID=2730404 RepID=UPI00158A32E4|nr:hypothetical protein [Chryseobacterium schmidteae]
MKMLLISATILLLSCSSQSPKYIQGYIFSKDLKPIENIKVQDPNDKNIFSYTNPKGYFKINQMIKGRFLYVMYNEKKIDSIYIVTTHPERGPSYNFVEGKSDTLFVDVK